MGIGSEKNTKGARIDLVAEFDPKGLTRKTYAGHWRHLRVNDLPLLALTKINKGNLHNNAYQLTFDYSHVKLFPLIISFTDNP